MYVILIHQRYRRTDRRTDGQTDDMRSQYRALHYSASRGNNYYTQYATILLNSATEKRQ